MASTFYDWHSAASQPRMNQKNITGGGGGLSVELRQNPQGGRDDLAITFHRAHGKQITFMLDKDDARYLRDNILVIKPTDEITRLRLAMTSIRSQANLIRLMLNSEHRDELVQGIIDTCNSWPAVREQSADVAEKDKEIARLKKKIADMQDAASQLNGLQPWISDRKISDHFTKYLSILTKQP